MKREFGAKLTQQHHTPRRNRAMAVGALRQRWSEELVGAEGLLEPFCGRPSPQAKSRANERDPLRVWLATNRSAAGCGQRPRLLHEMVGERGFEPPTPWSRICKIRISCLISTANSDAQP